MRDGDFLVRRIRAALPLHARQQRELFEIFTTVIRATVKGNLLMAIVQGTLGGIAFWFLDVHAAVLWAVVMAFLSLLPAVGSALVWVPVAIYFLATGDSFCGTAIRGETGQCDDERTDIQSRDEKTVYVADQRTGTDPHCGC